MGLRETKVARTRAQIVDVAVNLFLEKGYDGTTMEEIAEQAEVGTTTLYRYFPSKDLILLDPFTREDPVADTVRSRPADEPIDIVLGHAVLATFAYLEHDQPRINAIRTLIDESSAPRARLWDVLARNLAELERAIAERTGAPVDSVSVRMTARVTQLTIELAADTWRSSEGTRRLPEIARTIMAALKSDGVPFPAVPPSA
ncbi:MAG TPA: helix-turn-helix domain-containing protein [Gryllotalpicola sp.]